MRRRVLVAGGLSGFLAALPGCGPGAPTTRQRLNAEVEDIDQVTSSDVERVGDGTMRTSVAGDIHFGVGADQLLIALDPAWRVVVEYVFERDEGRGEREVLVTAHGTDGSTVAPRELLGAEYADQVGPVSFGPFYEYYDLV